MKSATNGTPRPASSAAVNQDQRPPSISPPVEERAPPPPPPPLSRRHSRAGRGLGEHGPRLAAGCGAGEVERRQRLVEQQRGGSRATRGRPPPLRSTPERARRRSARCSSRTRQRSATSGGAARRREQRIGSSAQARRWPKSAYYWNTSRSAGAPAHSIPRAGRAHSSPQRTTTRSGRTRPATRHDDVLPSRTTGQRPAGNGGTRARRARRSQPGRGLNAQHRRAGDRSSLRTAQRADTARARPRARVHREVGREALGDRTHVW